MENKDKKIDISKIDSEIIPMCSECPRRAFYFLKKITVSKDIELKRISDQVIHRIFRLFHETITDKLYETKSQMTLKKLTLNLNNIKKYIILPEIEKIPNYKYCKDVVDKLVTKMLNGKNSFISQCIS